MRKLFVIALMTAVLTGAIFAQELRFDGYLNSGLGVINVGDNDPYVKVFGVDSEQHGYRFRLNGSYQNEAKNAGVRFRFQSQSTLMRSNSLTAAAGAAPADHTHSVSVNNSYGYFSLPYVYGWVSFFDNKLSLSAGIVDDTTWETVDMWFKDDVGEGLGLLLKASPIDGLNLGVGAYLLSQQGSGNNNILSIGNNASLPNFANIFLPLDEVKYVFSGSYTVPNVLRIGASFRTKNQAGWDNNTTTYIGRHESSQLVGEIRILAVKNLTGIIVGVFDKLEDFGETGNITISETFAYKINDQFNLGLNAVQFLYNRATDVDPGLLFNVWGSYAFGSVVPRLDVVYLMGGRVQIDDGDNTYHRRGFQNQEGAETSVLSVRPSIRINLDNRTFLEIGDIVNYSFSENAVSRWNNEKTLFSNVFYIDVKWSF
jgi:hypothetical protein